MDKDKLIQLADLYIQGKANREEQRQLHDWYDGIDREEEEKVYTDDPETEEEIRQRIFGKVQQRMQSFKMPAKVDSIRRSKWRRVAAAAAVLILISLGGYLLFKPKPIQQIATTEPQEKRFKNDVAAPTNTKATITLANGTTVTLDNANSGTLATQGGVNVVKTADGKIIYQPAVGSGQLAVQFNTLNNPRGSKVIDMTLADGSRVWLNAGSSVTYPVAFTGTERKVSISGEAYFEVAHNATMPFKVSKGTMEIIVLGTHFNVNAYDDESNIKITLLEGSVKVTKGPSFGLLIPGQQALVASEVKVINGADLEEVMAWKNGKFFFNHASITSIMKQMARWYDVDVQFEYTPTENLNGTIPRDLPISNVFKVLELTGEVQFRIEGKKVTVTR